MRNCPSIQDRLDDWLDGLVDVEVREEIDRHLAACPCCAAIFERHRRLAENLRSLGCAGDRLADAARPQASSAPSASRWPRPSHRWVGWQRPLATAATVILAVTIGFYILLPSRTGAPIGSRAALEPTRTANQEDSRAAETAAATAVPSASSCYVRAEASRMVVQMPTSNPRVHLVWLYDQIPAPKPPVEENRGPDSSSSI